MRTPTHAAFGLLVTSTAFSFWSLPLHLDPGAVGTALVGSLLPDLDTPKSLVGRLLPRVSRPLEEQWAHRGAAHSLAALGVVAMAGLPLALCRGTWLAALLLGYASHLLADCLTKAGAPLLHPCLHACVLPGSERFRLRSRSTAERVFLVVVLLLLVPAFTLSRAGGVWRALRHWTATPAMAYREYRDATSETVLEFQGQWQDTRQPVAGAGLILEASPTPTRFLIELAGEVWVYGEQGDILPQRSRIRITGRPLQADTLRVQRLPYTELLDQLPERALATGLLESQVPYAPGLRGELPRSRHQSLRCDQQTLTLAFAPRALLARLHPSRQVDPEHLAQVQAQVRQARTDLEILQLQRPPAHVLRLEEALEQLRAQHRKRAALQDSTVRFTGVLYLRRPPMEATP